MNPILARNQWGEVAMVKMIDGERYYWMVKDGVVSMIPAVTVEEASR